MNNCIFLLSGLCMFVLSGCGLDWPVDVNKIKSKTYFVKDVTLNKSLRVIKNQLANQINEIDRYSQKCWYREISFMQKGNTATIIVGYKLYCFNPQFSDLAYADYADVLFDLSQISDKKTKVAIYRADRSAYSNVSDYDSGSEIMKLILKAIS